MDEPGFEAGFLRASRVAIWGLGLMGGSLAMALRGKCAGLVGLDTDPSTVNVAVERGIVDEAAWVGGPAGHVSAILRDTQLLVLAAPVRAIMAVLDELPALVSHSLVVMDLGSTKEQIVTAMNRLPENFDPVGGHPMCGKEQSSIHYAEANLYHGAPFALVPLERTSNEAIALAEETARVVGACPLRVNAADHDWWVAATSHAPFLAATALARTLPEEAAVLAGPGFRGSARLAASSPRMMVDILATNTEPIRDAIARVRDELEHYDRLLRDGDYAELSAIFEQAGQRYLEVKGRSCGSS